MNFKKILTFAIALTLTATPQTVNAEIKTKHLWYATGALTTATIVGFADAYYGDCEVLHKEPSFREFVFYVGRFAKNIASQKETRSVAMQQHPLLTAAVAATVLTGLSSAGKTTYDYFNKETKEQTPKEQKPEEQKPEEQKSEEQKSEEQKAKEELLKELNALEAITPEKDATESASEFAEITTIEKLGSPTAKTDAQKAELKVKHDKKRAEQKALFDELSKENQEKQLAEQKLKRAEQKEAQSKERERRAQERRAQERKEQEEKYKAIHQVNMTEKAQTRAKAEAQRLAKETPGQKETREKEEALLTEKAHQAQAAKKDALQETAAAMQANAIRIKTEAKERKQAKRKAKLEKKAEQAKLNTEAEAKKQQEKDIEEEENRRGQKKSLLTSTSTAETNVDKILSGVKKFETDASFIETNEYDTWKRDTKTKYKELSQEEKKLLSPLEGNWGWKILEKAAWFPNYFNKFAQLTEKKASKIELTADEASLYTVLLKVLS